MAGIFDPGIFDSGIFDDAPPEGAFQSDTFQSDAFQEDASGAVTATTTDAPTTSDAATRTGVLARSLTDAPTTSDVVTRAVAVLRTTSEAFSSSESVVAGRLIARSTTDVFQTSDAAAAFTHYGSVEAPHTSDVVTRSAVLRRAATDSVYMAQAITRIATFPRTSAESISTSESVVHGPTAVTTDHPVATVVATRSMTLSRTASDGIRGSDVVINHNTPFVEGTAIYIGGTNVAKGDGDPALYASARFMSAVNGVAGEAHLRVRDDTGTMVYTVGDPLELVIDGQRVWTGFVMKVTRTYVFPALNVAEFGPTRFFDIEGSDLNLLLTRRIVFKDSAPEDITAPLYPPHTPDVTAMSALFAHWLDLSGDGLDTSTDVHNVADINEDQQAQAWKGSDTWADAMKSIAALPAAIFYIRPNWLFAYVDTDTPDAPFGLSDVPDGVTTKGYREAEVLFDGTNLANDVLAFGVGYGSNAPVVDRLRDTTSISDHGTWQLGQTTFGVYKQNTINRIANSIVNGSPEHHRGAKDDRHAVTLTTYEKGLLPAQKVNFESNVFGFSEVLPIRKMEVTFDAPDVPKYTFVLSNEIDTPWSFFDPYPPFQFPGFKMPGIGQITVTPPPNVQLPGSCVCGTTDTFVRADTVSPNWGTADDGTRWTTTATNTATTVAVANIVGNEGHLFVPVVTGVSGGSGGSATATLPGHLPTMVLMDFELPQWNPSGDTGNLTQRIDITSGSYTLSLNAKDPTHGELLILSAPPSSSANVAYSLSPATPYHLRWEITGTESRVRIWTGGVEPSTWDLTLTTSAALGTNSFQIGLLSVRGNNSAHNEAVEANFSLLELSTPGGVINRCTQFRFDNFNRTIASPAGWGSSDTGQAYTKTASGAGAVSSVNGSRGVLTVPDGRGMTQRVALPVVSGTPWTMTTQFNLSNIPTSSPGGYNSLQINFKSGSTFRFKLDAFIQNQSVNLGGDAYVDLFSYPSGPEVDDFSFGFSNAGYNLKIDFDGTNAYRCKVWLVTDPEPSSWLLTNAGGAPVDTMEITWAQIITGGPARTILIDYIDFDYDGKPCYEDCVAPSVPVVIGGNSDKAAYSSDGISWSPSTPGFSGASGVNAVRGIAYSPELGLFVAVGPQGTGGPTGTKGEFAISSNGSSWSVGSFGYAGGPVFVRAITWSSELRLFVAVGGNGNSGDATFISTSPDGTTWTTQSDPFSASFRSANCVTWSPQLGLFLLGADSTLLATSPDGALWTPHTSGYSAGNAVSAAAWSPALGLFVIGSGGAGVRHSSDGINWFAASASVSDVIALTWSPELGLFLAGRLGAVTPRIATSPDGDTWSTHTSTMFTSSVSAVAWSASLGLFVAAGTSGKLATSPDGTNWTAQTSGFGTDSILCAVAATALCTPVGPAGGGAVFGSQFGIAAALLDSTHYTISRSVQPGTAQVYVGTTLVSPVTDYAIDTETGIISFATAIDPATPVTVVIVNAAGPPVTPPPVTLPPGGTFSTLVFDDDFNRTIAEGHFLDGGISYTPGAAFYKTSDGLYGVFKYGWSDTSGHGRYDPSIISVHDSMLDLHIQTKTDGIGTYPRVAALTCLPTGSSAKGGILGGRMRIVARADSMQYYKGVPLWWADASVTNANLMIYGEIDWPESDFDHVPHGFMHRTNSSTLFDQYVAIPTGSPNWQDWHEYITEWIPGTSVRFYLDGVLVGETFDRIPTTPMHFNLQFETGLGGDPSPAPATNGHVQIDRVQIWSYTP